MEKKPIREIVSTVMKALTLAMGIAVIVLSCLGQLEVETATIMLGIGLASAGIWLLFPDRNPCGSGHFLKHMQNLSQEIFIPLKLRGDDYFNLLGEWIERLYLGASLQGNEGAVLDRQCADAWHRLADYFAASGVC